MEFDKIVSKICEETSKPKEEILKLIDNKVEELSGLITKDGASLIIANELGIKIDPQVNKKVVDFCKISDITQSKVPVSFISKVIRKYDKNQFDMQGNIGYVQSVLVGDDTGIIRTTFWNDNTKILEEVKDGDVLEIENAYTRENKQDSSRIDVHYGQYSNIRINPENIKVEVKQMENQNIDFTHKKINEVEDNHKNIKVSGVITDFEIPRFYFADPSSYKKVIRDEDKYVNPNTGEVVDTPLRVPIINFVIDDGTSNISVVGFRDKAEKVTKSSSEDLIDMNVDDEKFQKIKEKMVGSKIEVGGNVSISNLTGEKQFLINDVLKIEFKTIEEISKELVEEEDSQNNQSESEEVSNENESENTNESKEKKQSEDDLLDDIEEIDFDDDL